MKNKIILHFGLTLILLVWANFYGMAQQVVVGSNSLNTFDSPISITDASPIRYSRSAAIYTAAEITAAGGYAGTINNLAWFRTSPGGPLQPNNNGRLKIYIKPMTSVFDSSTKSWALLKNNSTLVFSDTTVNFGTTTGWKKLNFNTSYNWNGTDNLLVLVDWENPDSSSSKLGWRYSVVANTNLFRTSSSISAMSTMARNSNRPNIQFGFSRNLIDAELNNLTIERMKCVGDSTSVSCSFRNNSNATINSFTLAMSINGILKFSKIFNSHLVSASDTTINIGKIYLSSVTGENLKLWIVNVNNVADQINTNDTIRFLVKPALSGVYTVGGSGEFTSLEAVVNAINSRGICSNVIINFDSTAGPFTGVYHLYNYNQNTNYTLAWNGFGTILNVTIPTLNTFNQQSLLYLHGVKNITINGFNFKYISGNSFGSCIQVSDSSENIQIRNNTYYHQTISNGVSISLKGNSEALNTLPVKINNVIVENNYFSRMRAAVEIEGFKNYPLNVVIRKNSIVDLSYNGLVINDAINTQIIENDIYSTQLNTISASNVNGIRISGLSTGSRIDKNRIHNLSLATNVTSSQEIKGIYCYSVSDITISNNLIYNVANEIAKYYGIYCYLATKVNIDYNTISSGNNNVKTGLYYGLFCLGNNKLKIRNNIFHYNSSSSAQRAGVYFTTPPDSNIVCDYNLYYTNGIGTGTNLTLKTGTANYTTLAQWKIANAGLYDSHSVEGDPILINVSSGNLLSNSILANNNANPISTVLDDYKGLVRSTTNPDIGAYEYNLITSDAHLQTVIVPTSECGNPQIVKVQLRNIGTQLVDSVELNWMVNGVLQSPQKHIGLIAIGSEQLITIGSYPMTFGSNYTIKAWIKKVNGLPDNNPLNDTANLQFNYSSFSGIITVGGPTANFPTLTAALQALSTYGICSTITVSVDPKYGPYNEQVTVNAIAGLSQQKQLILKGNGAEFTTSTVGTTNNFVFRLNGVSYVTIDGFVIRTNPNNGYGFGVHLKSNSNYNSIINNKFYLDKSSSNLQAGVCFNAGESTTSVAGLYRGNLIENNIIEGSTNSIRMFGTSANKIDDSETIIRKNTFIDFLSSSIQVYDMDSLLIYENEFYQNSQLGSAIGLPKAVFLSLTSPDKINRIYKNNIHDLVNNNLLSKNIQVFDVVCSGASTVGKDLIIENNLVYNINTAGKFYFFSFQDISGVRMLNNTISVNYATSMFSFVYSISSSISRHYYYNNLNYINNASSVLLYNSGTINFNGLKSDYNSFFRGNSSTLSFNTFNNSYAEWKASIKCDSNTKIQINPNLLATNNILPSKSSVVLGAGKGGQGVVADFLGHARSTNSPSIGAIEMGRSELDGPSISYSKLNLNSSTINRVVTNFAFITDTSGIDTNKANRPRFYFKKRKDKNIYISNAKGIEGWKYVVSTNTSSPYSFIIDYKLLKDSSVNGGDLIDYFVQAKDKLGNNAISNYSFSNDLQKTKIIEDILPITTTFDYYSVAGVLPDTIFVGKQHLIKSLTSESGLFQLLQNNYLSKKLTVIITSDLIEDGTYTFREPNLINTINAPITILPLKDSTFILSSTSNKPVIQLDGADSVKFGSTNPKSRLIFKKVNSNNPETSYVVVINSDTVLKEKSVYTSFVNCDFQTIGIAKHTVGVYVGVETNGVILNDNKFIGNKHGVFFNPKDIFNNNIVNKNIVLLRNTFNQDTLNSGIYINKVSLAEIKNNTINVTVVDNTTFNNQNIISTGIRAFGYLNKVKIDGNKIYYIPSQLYQSAFRGIDMGDTIGSERIISNNLIFAQHKNNTTTYNLFGIYLGSVDSVDVLYNSVYFKGNVQNGIAFRNIALESCKFSRVQNNSLINEMGYTSSNQPLIYMYRTSFNNVDIDYNQYYTNLKYNCIISYGSINFDSLTKIIPLTKSNKHSIFGEVNLMPITYKPVNMLLFGKALKYSSVFQDINGIARAANPSIGAFELDSISKDLEISKIISPENCIDTTKDTEISFLIKNNGNSTVTNSYIKLIWGSGTRDTVILSNNVILEPSSSKVISYTLIKTMGKLKNGYLKAICLLDSDQVKLNDSVTLNLNIVSGNSIQFLQSKNDTICSGELKTISARDPIYRNIEWYDRAVGGNLIAQGNTINYKAIKTDTLFMQVNANEEVDSLGTGDLAGSNAKGIFLNISNTNSYPISISRIDLFMQTINSSFYYSVYGKSGTYNGFETTSSAWVKHVDNSYENTYNNNDKRKAVIKLNDPVYILPGQTYAFYIDALQTTFSFSTLSITNSIYNYQKNGVLIYFGNVKLSSGFTSGVTTNRKPQVTVYYNKTGKCYISSRVKYTVFVPPIIKTSIVNESNIIIKSGTINNPDVVCANSSVAYKLLNPFDRPESEYNVTWRVNYKRFYTVENNQTINWTMDSSRKFNLYIPGNVDNRRIYGVDYSVMDLRNNCTNFYTRYLVFLKNEKTDLGVDKQICAGDSVKLTSNVSSPYVSYLWSNGKTDSSITVKTQGTYKLKVLFGNCTFSEDSVFVNVIPSFDSVTVIPSIKDSCRYEFHTNVIPNAILNWDFGDGFTATGNIASHIYNANGTYKVRLSFIEPNSCIRKNISEVKIDVVCFSGIENQLGNEFQIYPNPSSGLFYVSTKVEIDKIEVYSMDGKLVKEVNTSEIDLSAFPDAFYAIRIISKDGVAVKKLWKQN